MKIPADVKCVEFLYDLFVVKTLPGKAPWPAGALSTKLYTAGTKMFINDKRYDYYLMHYNPVNDEACADFVKFYK